MSSSAESAMQSPSVLKRQTTKLLLTVVLQPKKNTLTQFTDSLERDEVVFYYYIMIYCKLICHFRIIRFQSQKIKTNFQD